ncbi:ATP-binding protein [Spiroplasma endosymbiont of Amphibalanus improvisus]|uniref:ATP-binding protein n=1 Tax=Spiroplasma endosymbiont of Amphibalanus improvisus TaxID=3066327 RepID=UPI00313B9F28
MENKKLFDLNIEKILENWETFHAIREIIANALDEQLLSKTKEIQIYKSKNEPSTWYIRDFGRGLQNKHLTQNENIEKTKNENLIGQFGIGLKDALATFHRKNIKVLVKSKYLNINKIYMSSKENFEDIKTLHVIINEPNDKNFCGTIFAISGIDDSEMEKAKKLFLNFSNERILETNKYGQIIEKNETSCIYLNGIKVAEETNFLFSYNITSLDKKIKKALNRERTNVGRVAYSDRIKLILKNAKENQVFEALCEELEKIEEGIQTEEIGWTDVQEYVIKKYSTSNNSIVFLSRKELENCPGILDEIKMNGKKIIFISNNIRNKIENMNDFEGKPIQDLNQFLSELKENFEYKFVEAHELENRELKIFNKTDSIINLICKKPKVIKNIKISEVMQKDTTSFMEILGIWDNETGTIIIKRSQLKNLETYSGTLLHEVIHAVSGKVDNTREFENELTNTIGTIVDKIL